jgi:predicted DNA binding CopG/RHH family protein
VLLIGEKEIKYMTKKTDNSDMDNIDFELGERVIDFLPKPEQLIRRPEMQRVTMEIPTTTLSFFKNYAKLSGGSYQSMIRELLTQYAQIYTKNMKAVDVKNDR